MSVNTARVLELAERRGYTLPELADAVQVAPSVFYMLRAGKRKDMTGATLRQTASVLGTSTDYLLDLRDDPRPTESRMEEDEIEFWLTYQQLSGDARSVLHAMAEQIRRASTPRIVG